MKRHTDRIEGWLNNPATRALLNSMVIKIVKKELTLPPFDDVVKVMDGLTGITDSPTEFTPTEAGLVMDMLLGLELLAQLSLAKERM